MDPDRRKIIHETICRLADGDRTVMPELVHELWPVLFEYARRSVPEPDAEDVAQEVFLRICTRIAEFDPTRDGVSWAFGIASYAVLTHRRKVQRRRETAEPEKVDALATQGVSQEEVTIRRDLHAALREVLGQLSEEDLVHLGPGTSAHAAVSGATLRKRRQRAMARLRLVWRKLYGEP
jgi:RNA polymerase sigma-70 factor (ECF subfamily)